MSAGLLSLAISPTSPQLPAPANAWGYTALSFFDDFTTLSSVDVNNTKVSGYKWFVNNKWPLMNANGTSWAPLVTSSPTPANYFSVNASGLTISDDISKLACGCMTAAETGTGSTYVGQTFGGGFYAEVEMKFDQTAATITAQQWQAWPIYWFVPIEFLTGQITNTNFVEVDGFESYPTGSGSNTYYFAIHDWNTSNGTNNSNTSNADQSAFFSGFDFSVSHKYGTLYVPKALNGGTGLIKRYVDGTHLNADVSFTNAGASSPALSPTSSNGALSEMDSENFVLIIGAGHPNWPVTFGSVQVWQLP